MNHCVTSASVVLGSLLVAASGIGCAAPGDKAEKSATVSRTDSNHHRAHLDKEHAPKGKGWVALFNGKDLSGWVSFPEDRPNSWKIQDGVLMSAVEPGQHGRNIYTDRNFEDFELYYEYCVPANGNSGVFLRGQYEIQIVDDYGVPADKPKDFGNGGIYGEMAPSKNMSKPAGEWQCGYAKVIGKKVTVFINGVKVIDEFSPPGPTFLYGELKVKDGDPAGPIVLQGDHTSIKYRCVMIKPLKK